MSEPIEPQVFSQAGGLANVYGSEEVDKIAVTGEADAKEPSSESSPKTKAAKRDNANTPVSVTPE
jgi:hypothetical protein